MYKVILLTAALSVTAASQAQFFAFTETIGYDGTITKYATLADAQNQQNAVSGPHAVAQRDHYAYVVDGVGSFGSDANFFGTAWYFTTEENTNNLPKDDPGGNRWYSGWGNPNNTNTGFVQLYDDNANTHISRSGAWTDTNYDTFVLTVTGLNAGATDYARLWNAPNTGGPAGDTAGTFISYSYSATFGGLVGTPQSGLIVSDTVDPTSVTGSFTGIFQNTSTTNPGSNGFYVFNLSLNNISWAVAQGNAALNGDITTSQFGAAAVPEPATMIALGAGLLAFARRRRN
ncbi:MAG: PEP-CTERM sorting domain-containing protein [Fimbriimonadaceae bacterium]|nr:PEP-CTERM sorting domain-containing protein [Fimbriimonadaceae bacterium]